MRIEEFKEKYEEAKLSRPKVFEYMQIDPLASERELNDVEDWMACRFENSHRSFLKLFGGGEFGLGLIFSANKESEWYIPSQFRNLLLSPSEFFPVSDNFAGDVYGFEIRNGKCLTPLKVFDHESSKLKETMFSDVYEFMDRYALRPA